MVIYLMQVKILKDTFNGSLFPRRSLPLAGEREVSLRSRRKRGGKGKEKNGKARLPRRLARSTRKGLGTG